MPAPTNLFGVKTEKAEAKPIKPIPKLEKAEETLPSKSLIESRPKSLGNKLFSNKRFQIFGFTGIYNKHYIAYLLKYKL